MIQKPASFMPDHTSPSNVGEFISPIKAYFSPWKCVIRLLSSPVSRCLNMSGLPDGVALPLIMKDVHAWRGDKAKGERQKARDRLKATNRIRFMGLNCSKLFKVVAKLQLFFDICKFFSNFAA